MKKDIESKTTELESKLKECYEKVNKSEQENVKLKEEKRILEELRKIDTDKQSPDIPAEEEVEEEDEADVIDLEDNDPDDDEVIAYYLNLNLNKSRRTSPMTEAEKETTTPPPNDQACELCKFKTNRKDVLLAHIKAKHSPKRVKCDKCDFMSNSPGQMKKHFDVRHKDNPNCWYWCHGICRNNFCRFEHPANIPEDQGTFTRANQPIQKQRSGQNLHSRRTEIPCHYQEGCRNPNCQFVHFLAQTQVWNQRW